MKPKQEPKPIRLFLLDTRERVGALEQAFHAEGVKDLAVTSYDERGVSRTPLAQTDFSSRLPGEFDIYMVHLPLTTHRAILDLRKDKPSAFIWLNSSICPWSLPEGFRQNLTGYYNSEEPSSQVRKVMSVWQEAQK